MNLYAFFFNNEIWGINPDESKMKMENSKSIIKQFICCFRMNQQGGYSLLAFDKLGKGHLF